MLQQVPYRREEKCTNFPLCTVTRKRPVIDGVKQPRLDFCRACLANSVCTETGCCNHVPTSGKVPGKKIKWSPHRRCAEHVRVNTTPACEWTFCDTSPPGCKYLSMQYGKGPCYACYQGYQSSVLSLESKASASIPGVSSSPFSVSAATIAIKIYLRYLLDHVGASIRLQRYLRQTFRCLYLRPRWIQLLLMGPMLPAPLPSSGCFKSSPKRNVPTIQCAQVLGNVLRGSGAWNTAVSV